MNANKRFDNFKKVVKSIKVMNANKRFDNFKKVVKSIKIVHTIDKIYIISTR